MPNVGNMPPSKATANKSSAVVKKTVAVAADEKTEARTAAVAELGSFAQIPLLLTKQYADAGALSLHWPKIAGEIGKLAATNEQIAKLVDPLMTVGPYAGLITAIMPLVAQIAVNHGRVAAGVANTVPASTLSSQIETAMAQNELAALKIQRDAENESAKVRKEIADSRRALADSIRDQVEDATNGR
jgi:hypothetical protein